MIKLEQACKAFIGNLHNKSHNTHLEETLALVAWHNNQGQQV